MDREKFIAWGKAALVRAIRTVAQTAVATIGTAAVLQEINWVMVISASVLAGILSVLTSITGLPEVKVDNCNVSQCRGGSRPSLNHMGRKCSNRRNQAKICHCEDGCAVLAMTCSWCVAWSLSLKK